MIVELQLWQLISLLVTFLGGLTGWGKYLLDKTGTRMRETEKILDAHTAALARAPSREDISKIYDRVNASDSRINKLEGTFTEHAITMRTLLHHFIDKGVSQ
ncbi:MAG: hypothetical protein LBF61_02665 [Azoarcus sp.]|jgi:hypothetical protein|nr:hypothetical protein [Azoarcus sp.]